MFVISANGGFELPSYTARVDLDSAKEVFEDWSTSLIGEPGDRVDLIQIADNGGIAVVDSAVYGEDD